MEIGWLSDQALFDDNEKYDTKIINCFRCSKRNPTFLGPRRMQCLYIANEYINLYSIFMYIFNSSLKFKEKQVNI